MKQPITLEALLAEIRTVGKALSMHALEHATLDPHLYDGPCIYVPIGYVPVAIWRERGRWQLKTVHEWSERDTGNFAEIEFEKRGFRTARTSEVVLWLAAQAARSAVVEWREAQADEDAAPLTSGD